MAASYLPADRINRMRLIDERAMPDLCDLLEPGSVVIAPDGSISTGTTTVANIPCRMANQPLAVELLIAMRLTDVANTILSVPLGTIVRPQDLVRYRGKVYQVVGTDDGKSFATSLTVALKSVQ